MNHRNGPGYASPPLKGFPPSGHARPPGLEVEHRLAGLPRALRRWRPRPGRRRRERLPRDGDRREGPQRGASQHVGRVVPVVVHPAHPHHERPEPRQGGRQPPPRPTRAPPQPERVDEVEREEPQAGEGEGGVPAREGLVPVLDPRRPRFLAGGEPVLQRDLGRHPVREAPGQEVRPRPPHRQLHQVGGDARGEEGEELAQARRPEVRRAPRAERVVGGVDGQRQEQAEHGEPHRGHRLARRVGVRHRPQLLRLQPPPGPGRQLHHRRHRPQPRHPSHVQHQPPPPHQRPPPPRPHPVRPCTSGRGTRNRPPAGRTPPRPGNPLPPPHPGAAAGPSGGAAPVGGLEVGDDEASTSFWGAPQPRRTAFGRSGKSESFPGGWRPATRPRRHHLAEVVAEAAAL